MKLKLALYLILTFFVNESFSQSSTKNDFLGIWQIASVHVEDFYKFDYKTNTVTPEGMMLWMEEKATKDMISEIKAKAQTYYLGFNENESYASYFIDGNKRGTFEIYSDLLFENKTKDIRYEFSFVSSQELILISSDNEMKTPITFTFKKLNSNEILALKNNKVFTTFQSELKLSESENAQKYNEELKSNQESAIRNAKENQAIADRLNKEQSNSNKYYKSNISITKAIEIIREKFAANEIMNLIKNEKINSDTNLYKCTLSVADSKEFHVRDYEGAKTLVLTIAEEESRDNLTDLYYSYIKTVENWFKNKGRYKKAENWDDQVFQDDVIDVTIHLYGSDNGYVLQIEFSAS